MWSAKFLPHMNHVSLSPTDGNGPISINRANAHMDDGSHGVET